MGPFATKFVLLLFCSFCAYTSASLQIRSFGNQGAPHAPGYDYKTYYFNTKVDHFGYYNNDVYKMRYLVADQYWDRNGGPIFFYTGNEGDIAWFCNNTGIMWEWAPDFKAMLVFAEHRYYGESMPYGKDSYKDPKYSGYLTAEQALADFAELLTYIRGSVKGAANSPIITFGGSYGGMLSAWFRMKYPHVVVGALAASAPIWQFEGLTSCSTYADITTTVFENASPACAKNIRHSWIVFDQLGKTVAGRKYLSTLFRLCEPMQNVEDFKQWLFNAWQDLVMVNYPYPTSFLEPLPAWPVKAVCQHLSVASNSNRELAEAIFEGVSVYFNSSGTVQCYNLTQSATADLGDLGWTYQTCMEMVMPMCSNGINDMFYPIPWNLTQFKNDCKTNYQLSPRPEWIKTVFGAKNISAASNIIFSNGLLDPWSGGGVLKSISDSLVAITIAEGAHHLDLRASNPVDPPSVVKARQQEKEIIQKWIKNFYSKSV